MFDASLIPNGSDWQDVAIVALIVINALGGRVLVSRLQRVKEKTTQHDERISELESNGASELPRHMQ